MCEDIVNLVVVCNKLEIGLVCGEHIVQLSDKLLYCWDELNQSFRDEDNTIVQAEVGAVCHDLSDVCHDIIESLVLGLYLLAYKGHVRMCLQSALKCDV